MRLMSLRRRMWLMRILLGPGLRSLPGLDAAAAEQHGADAIVLGRGLPGLQPLLDVLRRAHQRRLVDQRVGYRGGRLFAVPRQEGILDLRRSRLVAHAPHVLVVEIL